MPYFNTIGQGSRDNGGYLLRSAAGAIAPAKYHPMAVDMLVCTFPFNQLNKLCGTDFVKKYKAEYNLLYVPRTIYTLLYVLYMRSQTPVTETVEGLAKLLGAFDLHLTLPGFKASALWDALIAALGEHRYHFGRFNAFAVAMMTLPALSDAEAAVPWSADDALELSEDGAIYFADFLMTQLERAFAGGGGQDLALKSLSARAKRRIRFMAQLDTINPDYTFLTRFGTSDVYTTHKTDAAVSAASYSQSFGAGLFEGVMGDTHASTILSIDKDAVFVVPIHMGSYRRGEDVPGDFFIPPIPSTMQIHAQMQELWHPRTRAYALRGIGLEQQNVQGVSDYGLYRNDTSAAALKILLYGGPASTVDEATAILRSLAFNEYIKKYKIDLPP